MIKHWSDEELARLIETAGDVRDRHGSKEVEVCSQCGGGWVEGDGWCGDCGSDWAGVMEIVEHPDILIVCDAILALLGVGGNNGENT